MQEKYFLLTEQILWFIMIKRNRIETVIVVRLVCNDYSISCGYISDVVRSFLSAGEYGLEF